MSTFGKSQKNIQVLVVDDSALVRKILSRELNAKEGIEVVGAAADPYSARDLVVKLKPDVLTLDIEMPRMDGITFLRKLMKAYPLPVIVLSSLAEAGSKVALEALDAGAFEVVRKPGSQYSVNESCDELAVLIRKAALDSRPVLRPRAASKKTSDAPLAAEPIIPTPKIIAIGASTGGVQALSLIFANLPRSTPGIVVVQHMPARFTSLFAERLNATCAMDVREAKSGDRVIAGSILLAPGGKHMTLVRKGTEYSVMLNKNERVRHHRPSVDVLFDSVAKNAGSNAVGVLLTGMGADGAEGLLKMKESGAQTVAQDKASSVVFGMPKEAIDRGAAMQVLPVEQIGSTIMTLAARASS